jgi:flagellum-specific peptidoglycan hydrolase FlgJ
MWFDDVLAWAQKAAAGTGLPVSAVLTQWGWETGTGTSQFSRENNQAGIKFTGAPGSYQADPNGTAGYTSMQAFVDDYVRVVKLGYYAQVRAAAPNGPEAVLAAWAGTPYAEDPNYSPGLLGYWKSYGLSRYDQATEVSPPAGVTIQETPTAVTLTRPQGMAVGAVLLAGVALLLFGDRGAR